MNKIGLDDMDRRQYMAYFKDGLWDLALALLLVMAGVLILSKMIYLAAIWMILIPTMVWASKKWLTVPRLSAREFDQINPVQLDRLLLVLMTTGLVVLAATTAVYLSHILPAAWLGVVRLAGLLTVLFTLVGLLLWIGARFEAPHWFGYAALLLLFAAVAVLFPFIDLPWLLIGFGAVALVVGLFVLLRFLASHPVLPESDRPAW